MENDQPKILVSACLAGIPCNYKGKACPNKKVVALVVSGEAIPVCPETLAGLPTPRPAVEIKNDRAISANGYDFTNEFMAGADQVVKNAKQNHCQKAILKSRSPSCGKGQIHDGNFSGKFVKGDGITTKALIKNGIEVITDEELQ